MKIGVIGGVSRGERELLSIARDRPFLVFR